MHVASNPSLTAIIGGLIGENQSKREQTDMVHPASALAFTHQLRFKDKAAWVKAEQGTPSSRAGSWGEEKGCHCCRVLDWGQMGTGDAEKGREKDRRRDPEGCTAWERAESSCTVGKPKGTALQAAAGKRGTDLQPPFTFVIYF